MYQPKGNPTQGLFGATLGFLTGFAAVALFGPTASKLKDIMQLSPEPVFKVVPQEVPKAVGGAAGWIGGLGAFGGFAIPPMMGAIVRIWGLHGYAQGFVVYIALALLALILVYALKWVHAREVRMAPAS
jgi:NNP family nitrate/nitrite transporter-like MFS transporter